MSEAVKLIRSPIDTNCVHCPSKIPFGVWSYYEPTTGNAVCVECATTKGWMSKERVNQLIKKLELQEDIKALRKQRKIETDELLLVRREFDLHEVSRKDRELEGQIVKLMQHVEEYLKSCGEKEEKKILKNVFDEIRKTQDLQKEVRELVKDRIFLLKKRKRKMDLATTFAELEESEQSQT